LEKSDLPIIINDFFSNDELFDLKSKMDIIFNSREKKNIEDLSWETIYTSFSDVQIDKFCGRAQLSLSSDDNILIPESVKEKLLAKAKEIDPLAEFRYFSIVKYSNEYGIPQLAPHCDHPEKETFLFDIQVDGNIEWPLMVNGEGYTLRNNGILVVDVQNNPHWRKPMEFKDDSFLYMLFVMFKNDTLELANLEDQVKKSESYSYLYNREFENLFGIKQYDWKEVRGK
jgi:hypothetical protein